MVEADMDFSLQTQSICRGAIENKEDFHVRSELLPELSHCRLGVRIITVSHRVSFIGVPDRLQYFGMHHGVIVAGKTSDRFHDKTI